MDSTPKTRVAAASVLVLALAAAGCPSSGDTCESSALCAEGTFCFEGQCVSQLPPGSVTVPGARKITYGGTASSNYTAAGTCPTTNVAPIAGAGVEDLGVFPVGATVPFVIPAGTASVTLLIQGEGAGPGTLVDFGGGDRVRNYVIPLTVNLPNGGVLYEFVDAFSRRTDPVLAAGYLMYDSWTASFTVPLTSRFSDLARTAGDVPAGNWTITLGDLQSQCGLFGGCSFVAPMSYRVSLIAKPGPYVTTGRLKVAIYFASSGVSAATAATRPEYQRMVEAIDRLLNRAGIAVDEFTLFDLPADAVTEFSTTYIDGGLPPCDEVSRLHTLAQPGFDGIHLFFVDVLASALGRVAGVTGSIPGPSGAPGAITGGIVMSLGRVRNFLLDSNYVVTTTPCGADFDLHCGADFTGYVAAHEIGHWLGLFHPTEQAGDLFDPLDDTAKCPCDACGDHACTSSTEMGVSACLDSGDGCDGGTNLMFWQVSMNLSVGDLSREQGFVMRANPAVKWGTP